MRKKKETAAPAPDTCVETQCVLPIEEESQALLASAEAAKAEMECYYARLLDPETPEAEVRGKTESLKRAAANMTRAMTVTYTVADELGARWRDLHPKKKRPILTAPANAEIDLKESNSNHFARGLNGYKLLLLCFVGSFAGVIIEMLWCLMSNGYIESRAGLVYGPFNLLYGVGAVVLTVCLYRFRNHGSWLSFLGGFLVGSVVEYLCSWGQELLIGSRSWDYSHMPFNLNGRICLLYSLFWGVLGVLWIKNLYPRVTKWILKIPNRPGKIATWVVTVFFVFNCAVSSVAVFRWSQRAQGVEPSSGFWQMIDQRFPDERMETIYANMEFSE